MPGPTGICRGEACSAGRDLKMRPSISVSSSATKLTAIRKGDSNSSGERGPKRLAGACQTGPKPTVRPASPNRKREQGDLLFQPARLVL